VAGALGLLRAAGWADTDGDTLLDKDGQPFRFTVLTADAETSVKLLTLARETMRQAGVELNIKVVDWSTLLQLIDEYKYDAVMLGWTRVVHMDPTPLWHSKGAVAGGLNLVRYRNPEVDRLIEAGVRSIPEAERIQIFRRIHEIIAEDQPYTFLLEDNHKLVAHRAGFRSVKPWYNYALGEDYWWITP
jgi:peptide/nickel transport system substrate-binding protein